MKRKLTRKNGCKLFAVLLAGLVTVATAEELPNENKLLIIENITAEKLAAAKGGNVPLSEVIDAVAEKMPLDAEESTPESEAIIARVKRKVRAQYPATDQDLSDRLNQ